MPAIEVLNSQSSIEKEDTTATTYLRDEKQKELKKAERIAYIESLELDKMPNLPDYMSPPGRWWKPYALYQMPFPSLKISDENTIANSSSIQLDTLSKQQTILTQADEAFDKSDFKLAIKLYNQLIDLNAPQLSLIFHKRATSHFNLGNYQAAIADWNKILKDTNVKTPTDAIYFCSRGNAYAELKNFEKAKQNIELAIQLNPDDEDIKQSYQQLMKELEQQRLDWEALLNQAEKARSSEHNYQKAISIYEHMLQLRPTDPEVHEKKALTYYLDKKYKQALETINKAISLNSNDSQYKLRIKINIELDHLQDAFKDCKAQIAKDTEGTSDIYSDYDRVLQRLKPFNEYQERLSNWNNALQRNLNFIPYLAQRAKLHTQFRKFDKAIPDFTKCIEDQNEDYNKSKRFHNMKFSVLLDLYFDRGIAYLELQQYQEAIDDFDIVLTKAASNGFTYIEKKAKENRDKALQELKKLEQQKITENISPVEPKTIEKLVKTIQVLENTNNQNEVRLKQLEKNAHESQVQLTQVHREIGNLHESTNEIMDDTHFHHIKNVTAKKFEHSPKLSQFYRALIIQLQLMWTHIENGQVSGRSSTNLGYASKGTNIVAKACGMFLPGIGSMVKTFLNTVVKEAIDRINDKLWDQLLNELAKVGTHEEKEKANIAYAAQLTNTYKDFIEKLPENDASIEKVVEFAVSSILLKKLLARAIPNLDITNLAEQFFNATIILPSDKSKLSELKKLVLQTITTTANEKILVEEFFSQERMTNTTNNNNNNVSTTASQASSYASYQSSQKLSDNISVTRHRNSATNLNQTNSTSQQTTTNTLNFSRN